MTIGKGDLDRKMNQACKFLEKREQVRVTLTVKGRQRGRADASLAFLNKVHEEYMKDAGSLVKPPTETNLQLTYNPNSK